MRLNNKGFTLLETLISLLTAMIILSLSYPLLKALDSPSYYQEQSARQFFQFVQEEINHSTQVSITGSSLSIQDGEGRTVTIESYGTNIRRRVDRRGHELLLRDVKSFHVMAEGGDVRISILMEGGLELEKQIYVFNKK
ncbi:ComGF family competence protein [Halobacillus litoralis]|uniref:competence type IV pilus minor pilin ComGF n=1 Tax=Halobacillus litoralis TaxID=45668 RepID=UPI001CD36C47|nr:competence type IV pilus minor pilin ComGF [Halobacillus litoralis]MCA0970095.1 ComGF family competence protein [Halobacillus litoralis]